jgi:predicted histidine transporter YuiF (NhaC family)
MKFPSEIKFGIIAGLCTCIWVLIEYFLGFQTQYLDIGEYTDYVSDILPFVFTYLCFRKIYLKNSHKNVFTYKKGLISGLKISTTMAIVSTLFMAAYYKYINPNFWQRLLIWESNKMKLASQSDIAEKIEEYKLLDSNIGLALQLITTIIIGIILSLFVSLIIKKKLKRNWQVNIS